MTGKPSQLARALIEDMCEHEMDGCCCAKWIFGLWHRALPSAVKQAVAHHKFNKDTYKLVLQLADDVFESTRPAPAVAVLDQGFHPTWPSEAHQEAEDPEVAVLSRGRGGA